MPTALITGANRGIGLEFVRQLAGDGWRVHAGCRQPDKARKLKAVEADAGGEVNLFRLDVTDGLQVARVARELADEPVDLLLNNAALAGPRRGFGDIAYDDWLQVFNVNTLAPMRMVETFAGHVAKSERKVLANVSSRMGSITQTDHGGAYTYRSSKAALNMVTKVLSVDLRERGVCVVSLHPGWVKTDMGGANAMITPEESVTGLRKVIDGLTPEDTGSFYSYDGSTIPW